MFKAFSQKLFYENGQVFPFLIALVVAVIIFAMITVNLGQIGIFRTDVSNAADAGALAGASMLSQSLLGLGLKSDMMSGFLIVSGGGMIGAALTGNIALLIGIYLGFISSQIWDYVQAMGEANMAWANAKRTALQYAFNNAGVDEPRPTFEEFLKNAYGGTCPRAIDSCYDEYLQGTSVLARTYARSGFSKFMEDNKRGYWDENNPKFGQIRPGNTSDAQLISGYGWRQNSDNTFSNSYDGPDKIYNIYNNYVEVTVIGATNYPLEMWDINLWNDARDYLEEKIDLPWFWDWIVDVVVWFVSTLIGPFLNAPLIGGLTMDHQQWIDDRPIWVTVKRYKKDNDLGIWRFRYGAVQAQAFGRAFREDATKTIEPALFNTVWNNILSVLSGGGWDWGFFDTTKHLFETELTQTY